MDTFLFPQLLTETQLREKIKGFAPLTSVDLESTPLSSLVALYRLHIHPKPQIDLSEYPSDTRTLAASIARSSGKRDYRGGTRIKPPPSPQPSGNATTIKVPTSPSKHDPTEPKSKRPKISWP